MAGQRQTKTYFMQLLENRHPGYTIEALITNALRRYGNERDAAFSLGITQQTFNNWKHRLGLDEKILRGYPGLKKKPPFRNGEN